jgi:membrane fusion protein (multidrug efflux system)
MSLRFLMVALLVAAPAFAQAPQKPITPTPAVTPEPVKPAPKPAAEKPAAAEGEAAALILAAEESTLSSQMAGRISAVRVGLGDGFKKGVALIEFDCSEQRAHLQAADAEWRGARENHLARMRLQALGAAGELEVTLAASAADRARSQVDFRRAHMAYCRVSAPYGGNVARLRVKVAESVPAGQPLIDVVNTSVLKAQMFVPAAWVAWLKPGAKLAIHVKEIGQSFDARVSRLNARVDGVSQQLEVEARIDKGKSGGLLPGMVGTAVFEQPGREQPREQHRKP